MMKVQPKHLLIVEDNHALREMLTWDFEDLGYRVTATDCCEGALAAAMRNRVDLALLDYNLPDGCGSELVDKLRALNEDMQIVICSGRACSQELDASSCHFEPKPVTARRLHELFQTGAADTRCSSTPLDPDA